MKTKNMIGPQLTRAYVLECIEHEGTPAEKVKFFIDTFKSEYGHEIRRRGASAAIVHYLQGLPSTINTAYANHEIRELLISWGYLSENSSDYKERTELDRYWARIGGALVLMAGKHGIDI